MEFKNWSGTHDSNSKRYSIGLLIFNESTPNTYVFGVGFVAYDNLTHTEVSVNSTGGFRLGKHCLTFNILILSAKADSEINLGVGLLLFILLDILHLIPE